MKRAYRRALTFKASVHAWSPGVILRDLRKNKYKFHWDVNESLHLHVRGASRCKSIFNRGRKTVRDETRLTAAARRTPQVDSEITGSDINKHNFTETKTQLQNCDFITFLWQGGNLIDPNTSHAVSAPVKHIPSSRRHFPESDAAN